MTVSRSPRRALRRGLVAAALAVLSVGVTAPATAAPGGGGPVPLASAITAVSATSAPVTVGGEAWTRTTGTVSGVVDPREQVAGLAGLPRDARGLVPYTSEFELIAPADGRGSDVVLVEAENRGRPAVLLSVLGFPLAGDASPVGSVYPDGLGNGWLAGQDLSYARVQWETGISPGVPATAQGVGEVIVRDLGRLLEGTAPRPSGTALPVYRASVLAGISQSAWFVDTFVAEGFNADDRTGRGVYDAAVAVSGAGNWLAVNELAGGAAQRPYVLEDGVPLTYDQILTRDRSDPLFVDVATYTDYHRLRASVTATADRPRDVVRYDWPAPHAGVAAYADAVVFGQLRCNGGTPVPRNPISYNPHLRTLLADVTEVVRHPGQGDRRLLPPSAVFALQPAPAGDRQSFNDLPGVELQVPRTDPGTAQPVGGVRFPDAVVPLGRPVPVALAPVGTTSITDVCGNWGGWQPYTAAELARRYGSVDGYLAQYAAAVDAQVRDGYLDASERAGLLAGARAAYLAAPQG
ncbi:alpha/beta hydrolase domain-containing protein [Geodermatophilus sp. SYSU D01036]